MNNFKKIGLTALAGSLVAVSAQAGEMSVSAGANLTYKSGSVTSGNSSKGIGSDMDVAFSGGGELDNGVTFSVNTATNDGNDGLTSSYITISTPSFGTFTVGHSFGSGSGKYDEEVPQVYEQVSDAHHTTTASANKIGDFMDNNVIAYTSPTFDLGGASISFDAAYSPQADDAEKRIGDGGNPAHSSTVGSAQELGVTVSGGGFKAGVYGAERERVNTAVATDDAVRDEFNGAWYAKYSFGPVSIGYSETYLDSGVSETDSVATNADKTYRTSGGIFENTQMSIAFNVNENFSISYTDSEDVYDAQSMNKSGTETADVTSDIEAIQIAYSMGGMSIKAYQMEATNSAFNATSDKGKETEIALGLAF
jgi:outer membrane protein OmpU